MNRIQALSRSRGRDVEIDPDLCFYNPGEVYRGLETNQKIIKWLKFVSGRYVPPKKNILLFYPCSAIKPYDSSPSYKRLLLTLGRAGLRERVHLVTVSEPFGLVPQDFYHDGFSWYDCPGLFKWWCLRHGEPYDLEDLEKSIDILSSCIAGFLSRVVKRSSSQIMIGFVRTMTSAFERHTDHTHFRMLKEASRKAKVDLEILPNKRVVNHIVQERGRLAWDYYGVSHPMALDYLTRRLAILSRESSTSGD